MTSQLPIDRITATSCPEPPGDSDTAGSYPWQDQVWRNRSSRHGLASSPVSIYRVSPNGWRRDDQGMPLSWRDLADRLVPYAADLGFTHIQLKGPGRAEIDEPGYGMARFVDLCHQGGIGVILEWPETQPSDDDPADAMIMVLERLHLDGLFLSPVGDSEIASLENAIETVLLRFPTTLVIIDPAPAMGSTAGPDASQTLTWNGHWSGNLLSYLSTPPESRAGIHDNLIRATTAAFAGHYVLPLTDDGWEDSNCGWLCRMPGDKWQRFANLRACIGFMWLHPGKKLLAMGAEFAQSPGWREKGHLNWGLFDDPCHSGMFRLVTDLNRIYIQEPALHLRDRAPASFAWVIDDDAQNSVIAFLRFGDEGMAPLLAVINFTPQVHHGYRVGVPAMGTWRELINSDSTFYGGSNVGNATGVQADNLASHGYPASLSLTIPPLAMLLLRQGDWPL